MTDHGGAASPRTMLMESLHDNELQIEGYDLGECTAAYHGDDADAVLASLASRGYRVAAQEAPAPEGLRAQLEAVLAYHHPNGGGERCFALATPPTPAEPPRPDEDWTAEDERRAVLREAVRAEARPPEGPFRYPDPATLGNGPEKSAAIHERLEAKHCWMRDCGVPTHGHDPRYETSGTEAYHRAEAEARPPEGLDAAVLAAAERLSQAVALRIDATELDRLNREFLAARLSAGGAE